MTLCPDRERFASAIEHRDTRASRNARPDASHDQIGGPMLQFRNARAVTGWRAKQQLIVFTASQRGTCALFSAESTIGW